MRASQESVLSDDAKLRLQWIIYFIGHQGSILDTCQKFGISRSTLHRWLERFDPANLSSLEEGSHAPRNVRQPMVPANVVALIRMYREQWTTIGKEKISKLILDQHGISISPSSVGRVIEQECFYFGSTPLHWRKRLEGKQMASRVAEPQPTVKHYGFGEMKQSKVWLRVAMVFGLIMQGLAASLAIAVLWQMTEKPKAVEASLTNIEINESVLPSVTSDE